ncbi:MAG: HlyD family efflux transporter periplasmic adaptor subunit [Lachnospiraceae bacterium]|nr:HlyD family efflux transporter periplasmic adaptor subunit [Lachnospiraceae bacterium]
MGRQDNYIDIRTYKKKGNFNIGILVFGVIFIYLVVTVLAYLTANHVSVYEVREGTILNDNEYSGLIIRNESVVTADADGYISYYTSECNKVAVGTNIYSITADKINDNSSSNDNVNTATLTKPEQSALTLKIQKYNESFNSQKFSDTYSLKNDVESILQNTRNETKLNQLNELITNGQADGMNIHQSPDDGIVVYNTDGFETVTLDNINNNYFDKANYTKKNLGKNEKIKTGDPAYKLITNESWSVVVKLTKDTASQLADTTSVKVKILKDNESLWANFKIIKSGNQQYGCLSFDNSMIRYATERYLDVEIIMADKTGLKIPKTAKISKSFYVIPDSYLTTGGNSKATGVYRQTKNQKGNIITEFVATEVYNISEEKLCYIDTTTFSKGDILIKPESTETMTVGATKKLQGVYNINKGYAVFKQINILCESDEYYIVEEGNSYGLSNYDHIVLDGNTVQENDIVFQ